MEVDDRKPCTKRLKQTEAVLAFKSRWIELRLIDRQSEMNTGTSSK